MTHICLLTLRLLTRDVFLKRAELDDYMGVEKPDDYLKDIYDDGGHSHNASNSKADVEAADRLLANSAGAVNKRKSSTIGSSSGGSGAAGNSGGIGAGDGGRRKSSVTPQLSRGTSFMHRKQSTKSGGKLSTTVTTSTAGAGSTKYPVIGTNSSLENDTHDLVDPWSQSGSPEKRGSVGGGVGGAEVVVDGTGTGTTTMNETEVYFNKWRDTTVHEVFCDYQDAGNVELSFPELLGFIGETHILSDAVTEQFLLLVQHLASVSGVCKLALLEAGIPVCLRRIAYTKRAEKNVYLVSLCEICLEDLVDEANSTS
jgi:hypothetical protein